MMFLNHGRRLTIEDITSKKFFPGATSKVVF